MSPRSLRLGLRARGSPFLLIGASGERPENAELVPPSHAAVLLEDALRDATLRLQLAGLAGVAAGPGLRADTLGMWVRRGLEQGELLLLRRQVRAVIIPLDDLPTEIPIGPASESPDLEFDVVYPDGSPVQGLKYVLMDPAGTPTKGVLPATGVVSKTAPEGTYSLAIVDIDVLVWSSPAVRAKKDVTLSARVSGIDEGAVGKVQIFRLYDEDPKNAIATLQATVKDKKAEATWQYVPKSDAESGTASFVAELSFDGGKVWKKTAQLDVELPQVASVTWSAPEVSPEGDVELVVTAPGFDDGADVKVTLMRLRQAGDETVGDLDPMKLTARVARAQLHCGDAKLPAKSGDVYAKVSVKKDGVERTGTSPLLWVSPGDADADGDADAAE
jgi:hypothetical protein